MGLLPDSIYLEALIVFGSMLILAICLMVIQGIGIALRSLALLVIDTAVPSRHRARAERRRLADIRRQEQARQRPDELNAPMRARREALARRRAEWHRRVNEVAEPLLAAWWDGHPDADDMPEEVLEDIFRRAEEVVGPEPTGYTDDRIDPPTPSR